MQLLEYLWIAAGLIAVIYLIARRLQPGSDDSSAPRSPRQPPDDSRQAQSAPYGTSVCKVCGEGNPPRAERCEQCGNLLR